MKVSNFKTVACYIIGQHAPPGQINFMLLSLLNVWSLCLSVCIHCCLNQHMSNIAPACTLAATALVYAKPHNQAVALAPCGFYSSDLILLH